MTKCTISYLVRYAKSSPTIVCCQTTQIHTERNSGSHQRFKPPENRLVPPKFHARMPQAQIPRAVTPGQNSQFATLPSDDTVDSPTTLPNAARHLEKRHSSFWPPKNAASTSTGIHMRPPTKMSPRDIERLAHLIQIERVSTHPDSGPHMHPPALIFCTVS